MPLVHVLFSSLIVKATARVVILSAAGAKDLLFPARTENAQPKAGPSLRARSARSAQDDKLRIAF